MCCALFIRFDMQSMRPRRTIGSSGYQKAVLGCRTCQKKTEEEEGGGNPPSHIWCPSGACWCDSGGCGGTQVSVQVPDWTKPRQVAITPICQPVRWWHDGTTPPSPPPPHVQIAVVSKCHLFSGCSVRGRDAAGTNGCLTCWHTAPCSLCVAVKDAQIHFVGKTNFFVNLW